MLRIISVARIFGQTGELILAGNRCYHHCSSRWRGAKPQASPIDNLKVGELLPIDCLPFLPRCTDSSTPMYKRSHPQSVQ